jgi:hypothetical protein
MSIVHWSVVLTGLLFLVGFQPVSQGADPKKLVDARLIVEDDGGLFSEDGIKRAKETLSAWRDKLPQEVYIHTMKELPKSDKTTWEKIDKKNTSAVNDFWAELAKNGARTSKAKGIYMLICRSPGHIQVITDRPTRERGFQGSNERKVIALLRDSFTEAKEKPEKEQSEIRDKGLLKAIEYIKDQYRSFTK